MNVNQLVKKHGFKFSKKFGQNFIGDENLLSAICEDAGIAGCDTVVEIGAGAGTLTRQLAMRAKRVVAYEIDESLQPILNETLAGLNNAELRFADIMAQSDADIDSISPRFKVVANLPYYITTPILFKLFECKNMSSATVMVQKEVAERICAKSATAEYGSLSVAIQLQSAPHITRIVGRANFTPPPNVDSAIVRMDICPRSGIKSRETLEKLVRSAFAMRRKTLVNNMMGGMNMSREQAEHALESVGLSPLVRGEALSVDQFINLANSIVADR